MSSSGRGHLRVYLGAAPGVGKTYKMLGEAQRRRERGTDIVVGLVETHGREHTAAMLEGLEVIPRTIIDYRGASFTELDLDAVLARRPEVVLVDELAHSNIPGSRHAKRWEDIDELLESLESNFLGWSSAMAPAIMGNGDRPELGEELTASFCRTDPEIAARFARVTFLSDNRADLATVRVPTLVLQCSDDVIAPDSVGEYVHERIPGSVLVRMAATGHCPNLSAPQETIDAIRAFV